jgi:spore germination protein YaaH
MLNREILKRKKYRLPFFAVVLLLLICGMLAYSEKISNKFLPVKKSVAYLSKKRLHKKSRHVRIPIRAAFYNPTDSIAYQSLKSNIGKVNMLIIDDMYIDPTTDSVCVKPGFLGRKLIQKSGVTTLALLSNFYGDNFNGASLHRIISDSAKTERVIRQIVRSVQANHFSGINIDFEELRETASQPLINFQKALYGKMHALGLLVTIDVIPFNEDYDVAELAKYNDRIFLMAYDQFNDSSAPGPVSSLAWIKTVLDAQPKTVAASKFVLGIAGYGYDWTEYSSGRSVSYKEAIRIAASGAASMILNDSTFNPHFTYRDATQKMHYVHFTSVKTNVAAMRIAAERGAGGVALWRLGTEDSRLWGYYDQASPIPAAFAGIDLNIMTSTNFNEQIKNAGLGESSIF